MKYIKLKEIIENEAHTLKENAGYSGSWDDGGSARLLQRLADFKNNLVIKHDLRPSEFSKLNDIEIDEPKEFSDIIEKHKLKLAKEIMKNMEL